MVTGTSVQDRILPRGVSNKQAVHFGNVALEDTNTLATLKIKHRSDSYVQDLEGMVVCVRNVHQSWVSGGAVWGRFRWCSPAWTSCVKGGRHFQFILYAPCLRFKMRISSSWHRAGCHPVLVTRNTAFWNWMPKQTLSFRRLLKHFKPLYQRLSFNSWSSCLYFPSDGITGICCHSQLGFCRVHTHTAFFLGSLLILLTSLDYIPLAHSKHVLVHHLHGVGSEDEQMFLKCLGYHCRGQS